MKPSHHFPVPRARLLQVLISCVVVGFAAMPALALAQDTAGMTDLGSMSSVPDAPTEGVSDPVAGGSLLAEEEAAVDVAAAAAAAAALDVDGSYTQLQRRRARLATERATLQVTMLEHEAARNRAEVRLDEAIQAIAHRLVQLFEEGKDERLQALMAVRGTTDPDLRATLLVDLSERDRPLIDASDAARLDVARAGASADAARMLVRAVGIRIAALDDALEASTPRSRAERLRALGKTYSIDADLVFATGPIPGIGYWGAMTDGGVLSGWMGYVGAAVGGVGCSAPSDGIQATGSIESGEASWYGPGFHGKNTASGEVYDQNAMTAAHKTLPFGTIVRVLSSATGRCAFVRITDRGPFIDGRIIDLSQAAATKIGMSGTAAVQIEIWAAPNASIARR